MSIEVYDDSCPGCRPVLLDPATGWALPDDSPAMLALRRVWNLTTLKERQAFHRVCCLNSRDPADLAVMESIAKRFSAKSPA